MKRPLIAGLALLAATAFSSAEEPARIRITGKIENVESTILHTRNDRFLGLLGMYTVHLRQKNGLPAFGFYAEKALFSDGYSQLGSAVTEQFYGPARRVQKDVGDFKLAQKSGVEVTIYGSESTTDRCLAIQGIEGEPLPAEEPLGVTKKK